ncbi:unnamed protein product [Peniophora sp. CBMAI 1063]|nr:unnamed protein product [Peniophora sp. CBMAI 1063]
MSQFEALIDANTRYVAMGRLPAVKGEAFFSQGSPGSPTPGLAIVTCMDRRLDPIRALDVEGKAAIIRNAGGVAADALRSLIVFQALTGGKDILIMHHTDCGLLRVSPRTIRASRHVPSGMDFHEFDDVESSIRRDVLWLKERVQEGALLEGTNVTGWLYETGTGQIRLIE